jgi:hypothetical protein
MATKVWKQLGLLASLLTFAYVILWWESDLSDFMAKNDRRSYLTDQKNMYLRNRLNNVWDVFNMNQQDMHITILDASSSHLSKISSLFNPSENNDKCYVTTLAKTQGARKKLLLDSCDFGESIIQTHGAMCLGTPICFRKNRVGKIDDQNLHVDFLTKNPLVENYYIDEDKFIDNSKNCSGNTRQRLDLVDLNKEYNIEIDNSKWKWMPEDELMREAKRLNVDVVRDDVPSLIVPQNNQ